MKTVVPRNAQVSMILPAAAILDIKGNLFPSFRRSFLTFSWHQGQFARCKVFFFPPLPKLLYLLG